MKRILFCIMLMLACVYNASAHEGPPGWTGPTSVTLGSTQTYTFDNWTAPPGLMWFVWKGLIVSYSQTGTEYSVTVQWVETGSGYLYLGYAEDVTPFGFTVLEVTINGSPPATPSSSFTVLSQTCNRTVVKRNNNPPSGVSWHWQSSPAGYDSFLGQADTVVLTTPGSTTLYLRAQMNGAPIYSAVFNSGSYTVYTPLAAPATATDGHRIGSGYTPVPLSVGAVSGATSYRWYPASANGTPIEGETATTYTPSVRYTKTYYVEAWAGGCAGASRKAVTANLYPKAVITSDDGTVNMGSTAVLRVENYGYDSYQWVNAETGVPVSGETSSSLTTSSSGNFRVRVTKGTSVADTSATFSVGKGMEGLNMNYVISNTILVPGITSEADVADLMVEEKSQTIQYVDGLGAPMQTVIIQGSPLKKDIVQETVYDGFGREHRKYLPVVVNRTSGWYKKDLLNARGAYSSIAEDFYQDNPAARIAQDTMPYTQTVFEASPAGRPLQDFGAGSEWAAHNKRILYDYRVNTHATAASDTAEKIIAWRINNSRPERRSPATGYVVTNGFYASGQLSIKIVKDEQGNAVREYTNKQGQLILKKVQAVVGDSSNLNSTTGWAATYYVYDDLGNLRFVLPPALSKIAHASDTAVMNSTRLANWAFQYTYDARKRMATKQVPGAGVVYMVYDNRDRLVATQDANQRSTANKYWTFTKYDQLNRPILTGIKDTAAVLTQAQMQAVVDAHYAKAWTKLFETYVGTATGNMHGYSNKSYPVLTGPTTTNNKDRYLSVTYYDDYGYKATLPDSNRYTFSSSHLAGQQSSYFKRLTGQVTGTKIKVLDGGVAGGYTWLTTVNYYDDDYRVIQTVSDNYKGGIDRITNKYDFTGRILKSSATHTTYDITWKDKLNVTLAGNKITKNVSGSGWNTSGAASEEQLAAGQDGWIEWTVTDNTTGMQRVVGLSDSNPDANINTTDYGIQMDGVYIRIYDGVLKPALSGAATPGELLRLERVGTTVYAKRNGAVVYTFPTASTGQLLLDAAFYWPNSSVANVKASFAETTHSITRSFTYDHAGRVLNVWHRLDSEDSVMLVKNEYNELGQLVDKKLHSTDGETFRQSVDYAYNIRGWLTKMNESDLSGSDEDAGRDLFGMQLGYNDDLGISNTALYNGNISGIKWSRNLALGDTTQNAYVYSYDPMNRITSSAFKEKVPASWQTASNYGNNETGLTYDLNGNILALQRNDRRTSGWMDNLTYDYGTGTAQSNKLLKVTDAGDKTKGFVDISTSANDYTYDANGNLLWDRNKGGSELLANGSFDNGSTGWTLTNSGRLTFISGEVQIAAGASASTLKQTVVTPGKPYVVEIDLERTAGTLTVSVGGASTNFTTTGQQTISVTAGGTADFTITAGTTFAGKIKSISLKGVTVITYNFMNLPEIVTRPGDKQLQYIYDASGRKLRQEVSKNTVMEKTTDYAGEYIYENDTLRFINHEEGRIVPSLSGAENWEYQYHLKDHLGNVRMTFTSKRVVDNPVATMETANETAEHSEFLYYDEAVKINSTIFDHTDSVATQYATRLTGLANHQYGLAKSLSVMPGDTVLATVFAKYLERDTTLWNNGNGLATLMNTVRWGTPAAGVLVDGGTAGTTGGVTPPFAALLAKGEGTETGAPKAYLNFLVFDRDYHLLDGGFIGVTTAAREYGQDGAHEELTKQLIIQKAGYVYLYLSNDNAALGGNAVEVFFDDFAVEHIKSPVVQQDDYYAFGLNFNSYQRENSTINKWKFQGQEHVADLDLGWDSFKWRNHMPDIGRFFNVDPLADRYVYNSPYAFSENSVIAYVELEGLEKVHFQVTMQNPNGPQKYKDQQSNGSRVNFTLDMGKKTVGVTESSANNPFMLEVKNLFEYGEMSVVDFEPELTVGDDGSFNIHGDLSFFGATDVNIGVKVIDGQLQINTQVDDIDPQQTVQVVVSDETTNEAGYNDQIVVGNSVATSSFRDKEINQKTNIPLSGDPANKIVFNKNTVDQAQKSQPDMTTSEKKKKINIVQGNPFNKK